MTNITTINIITAVSKYIFILLGAVFCLHGFLGHVFYKKRRAQGKLRKGIVQIIIVLFMTVLGNIVLFLNRQDFLFIVFLFMEIFYFFFLLNIFPMIYRKCNRILLNDMAFLMCVGMIMLARLDTDKLIRQYVLIWAGTIILLLVPIVVEKLHFLIKLDVLYCIAGIVLLGFVFVMGNTVYGANLSINIGSFSLQPSEFVKIGLILILANFLSRNRDKINEPKTLGMTALICVLPVGMVYLQPNLSTTIVICFMILCMVYVAGISYKWIAGAVAVGVPGFAALIYLSLQGFIPFLQKYQAQRIMGKIFHSSSEFTDLNRQQDNSMMAIGSGQLRGKGLFNNTLSSVKNGNFLSEEQTDFIFAVIGEELGFVGGVAVIALYALLVYECLWIAARAKDTAGRLIASGMAALLAFQSFANIAVATGIFPNTGLPLPFISSGLSSLLSMFIGMGVVLNVGLQRNNVTVQ